MCDIWNGLNWIIRIRLHALTNFILRFFPHAILYRIRWHPGINNNGFVIDSQDEMASVMLFIGLIEEACLHPNQIASNIFLL